MYNVVASLAMAHTEPLISGYQGTTAPAASTRRSRCDPPAPTRSVPATTHPPSPRACTAETDPVSDGARATSAAVVVSSEASAPVAGPM